jgi:hypothetical protein
MTMPSQLWRTVLAASSLSADQQDAAPDEEGSYGELADTLDQILDSDPEHPTTRTQQVEDRPSKRSGRSGRSA